MTSNREARTRPPKPAVVTISSPPAIESQRDGARQKPCRPGLFYWRGKWVVRSSARGPTWTVINCFDESRISFRRFSQYQAKAQWPSCALAARGVVVHRLPGRVRVGEVVGGLLTLYFAAGEGRGSGCRHSSAAGQRHRPAGFAKRDDGRGHPAQGRTVSDGIAWRADGCGGTVFSGRRARHHVI